MGKSKREAIYLKRIEIYGFKSFAQKSALDFEYKKTGNITAVVGPNGSGKSNVADAIRWVTGEQSTKNLRSKKSEDVIFCGSSAKPRGSYAEVTIILSDEKPVKFELNGKEFSLTEIEVARKLYRSGESEYLINRKKVRLTDVQQLLASLGFGQSSYTVIGQGMVDRLLFFSASERKVLFDEAAGVKQYEIKREQSLRKLESTEANLVRLRDILTELEPRVVNLRRLVKRAEGRKELEAEIKEVQGRYYGALLTEYRDLVNVAEKSKKTFEDKISGISDKIEKLSFAAGSAQINPFTAERRTVEADIARENSKRDKLREEVAYLRGQIESAKNNVAVEEKRLSALLAEKESNEKSLGIIASQSKELEQEIAKFESDKKTETGKLQLIDVRIEKLDQELANPTVDKNSANLDSLQSKESALEAEKLDVNNQLYSLRQQANFARAKQAQVENDLKSAKASLESLVISRASGEAKLAELSENKRTLASEVKGREMELAKVAKSLLDAETELHLLAKEVTASNLKELEEEISQVSSIHRSLTGRILAAKVAADFESIRSEFKDFGSNLDRMLKRFRTVTKAVNNEERERIENNLLEARSRHEVVAAELQKLQFELVRVESESSSYTERVKDLEARIEQKQAEISQIKIDPSAESGKSENELVARLDKLTREIADIASEIRKYSGAVSERQNAFLRDKDKEQAQARELRQIIHNLDLELSRYRSRLENHERDSLKLTTRLADIESEFATKDSVAHDTGNNTLSADLVLREKDLSRVEEDIAKYRGGLTQVVEKERDFEQKARLAESEKRDLENEKLQLQNQISNLEVDSAKAAIRLEDVIEEIRTLGLIISETQKYHSLDQMEKDVMKVKIENVRRRLDTTASVDPETEAEYHELELRATEMAAQVEDLTKAKEDLAKVVRELDERIKHQFTDIFKNIANEFNRYFQILFNGGVAKLALGEDEEGSFGIEISANPPGKRAQSLAALSGGERTLTSLALLFAILSVNPSPFVVLDEVDAALDESNTVRFIKILEDLAKKTQFIIISHNRDTMKSASSLYGVTMDESHISKLLSVKLTEALAKAK